MDVLLFVAFGFMVLFFVFRNSKQKGTPIPGPMGWPIVGYAFQMKKGTVHDKFSELAEKYGDIFQINVFGTPVVVLNSAELIRAAFSADPYKKSMNDRSTTFFGEKVAFGSKTIGLMQSGLEHSLMRKAFTQAMHVYGDGRDDFENKIQSELKRLVNRIDSFQGKEFEMENIIKRSLVNVVSILLEGHDIKDDDKDLGMFWDHDKSLDFLLRQDVDALLRTFPFLTFLPGPYKDNCDKAIKARDKLMKRYVLGKKASYKPDHVNGMVDYFIGEQLRSQKKGEDVLLTDERIMAMVIDVVAAGILTTLSTLCTMILCLMNHPEYQIKIQSELDRIIGRDRCPKLSDRQACVFTEAVVLEVQRYVTAAPLAIPHLCKPNIAFEGYDIPENSTVFPNVWHVHHDKKIWGDPWAFRPERWIDTNGELLPNDHYLRKHWLPFGIGRRHCVGESLARSRIFLYTSTLLQHWTFEMTPEHTIPCDPRLGHYVTDISCRPKPYLCRVVPR